MEAILTFMTMRFWEEGQQEDCLVNVKTGKHLGRKLRVRAKINFVCAENLYGGSDTNALNSLMPLANVIATKNATLIKKCNWE